MLDAALRRDDPDRWLSSRFVSDPAARARLVALYTLDGEWARAAAAPNALAAELRLAWWSDAIEGFVGGGPAEHPALEGLGRDPTRMVADLLQTAIEARRLTLEQPRTLAQTSAQANAAVAVMQAAVLLLDPTAKLEAIRPAALVWNGGKHGERELVTRMWPEVGAIRLPSAAFPAIAHVAFARPYAEGRVLGGVEKRWRVLWAVLKGRL